MGQEERAISLPCCCTAVQLAAVERGVFLIGVHQPRCSHAATCNSCLACCCSSVQSLKFSPEFAAFVIASASWNHGITSRWFEKVRGWQIVFSQPPTGKRQ